jgi:hypothetical protein
MQKYDRNNDLTSVVIYDSKCPYCSAVTKWLKRTRDIGAISWHEIAAQNFLQAQFSRVPFAVFLVVPTEAKIYAGKNAAKELCTRSNLPDLFGTLVEKEYNTLSKAASLLSKRNQKIDDIGGIFELNSNSKEFLNELFHDSWTVPFENS